MRVLIPMSELQPHDDFIHPTGEEPTWREACYFDFFDPASRLSSFGYIGVHPNQQVGDVIFALWRDDVLLGSFSRWDFNIPRDIGEERLGFGHLSFRPVEPFKTWEIYFDDGRVRVDTTFHAIHPAYFWGQSHGALEKTNSHHYEQQGHYTGEVRVGTERYKIDGVGVRDHAWGWGARAGIRRWIWASAQFSSRLAFNTFLVTLADGREIFYGYIWRGEQNELIRRSMLKAEYAPKGQAPAALALTMEGCNGDRVSASARVLNAFNTSFQERNKTGYHYFCAAEFHCEGQVGYGQVNVHWQKQEDRPKNWTVSQE
jgi:hypothetical protein